MTAPILSAANYLVQGVMFCSASKAAFHLTWGLLLAARCLNQEGGPTGNSARTIHLAKETSCDIGKTIVFGSAVVLSVIVAASLTCKKITKMNGK